MTNRGLEILEAINGFVVIERAPLGSNFCGNPRNWVFANASELNGFVIEYFTSAPPRREPSYDLGAVCQGSVGGGIDSAGQHRVY